LRDTNTTFAGWLRGGKKKEGGNQRGGGRGREKKTNFVSDADLRSSTTFSLHDHPASMRGEGGDKKRRGKGRKKR